MPAEQDEPRSGINYLDFEIQIEPGTGTDYTVEVIRSPLGEASTTMKLPFDEMALQNALLSVENALLRSGASFRQSPSADVRAVEKFGQVLFDALFSGEVRGLYDGCRHQARSMHKGLRIRLRVQDTELSAVPWEFLFDARQGDYLCLSRDTPLVRYLEVAQSAGVLAVHPPLRILGMVASPRDLEMLDVDKEKQRVEAALTSLIDQGMVELVWMEGQTWRDLHRELLNDTWHIFHYIGHGGFDEESGEGEIYLAGEDRRAQPLRAVELARLVGDLRSLRLVMMQSCEGARSSGREMFSSTASVLVRRGVPAVVAMQYPIRDRSAIEFARSFYESLVSGLPVDAAVAEGRKAISLAAVNTLEWATPVLFMRAPDGVLFNIQGVRRRSQASPTSRGNAARKLDEEKLQQTKAEPGITDSASTERVRGGFELSGKDEQIVGSAASVETEESLRGTLPALDSAEGLAAASAGGATRRDGSRQIAGGLTIQGKPLNLNKMARWGLPVFFGAVVLLVLMLTRPWQPKAQVTPAATQASFVLPVTSTDIPATQAVQGNTAGQPAAQTAEPAQGNQAGDTLTAAVDSMQMVYVPAGEFWMGSETGFSASDQDELPRRQVRLDAFWIDRFEVSNAQFLQFVESTGYQTTAEKEGGANVSGQGYTAGASWRNPPFDGETELHEALDLPVVSVSWYDAEAYCRWAGRRLPTEAEWEKAARGEDGRVYPWGDEDPRPEVVNFEDYLGHVAPVEDFFAGAGPYGALNMSGNVWEWVADWYSPDYYRQGVDENPTGPAEGTRKSKRGGAYGSDTRLLRAASRSDQNPAESVNDRGFRCAVSATELP